MKNNIISLILIVLIVVTLFSGCGGSNNNSGATTDTAKETVSTPATEYLQNEITETSEVFVETEPVVQKKGALTLEDCQSVSEPAMYILYSDGSLDKLYNGAVLNWSKYRAPQYGAFWENKDLIISSSSDVLNPKINSSNQLVIFCDIDNNDFDVTSRYAEFNIAPVLAKGCTISRTNADGKWEAIFFGNNEDDGSLYCSRYWRIGRSMKSPEEEGFDCTYINGIAVGDYPGIPLTEGTEYCNLQEGDTYKLGVVEGTALVEKEFAVNANYYFQGENTRIEITPTVNGYAIANLEDFSAGDYIVQIAWYDGDNLHCWSTHITIE